MSVAEILGLNDATPAPTTISVPEDIAVLVAVPDVALSCKLANELASLAAYSCNSKNYFVNKNLLAVTSASG